MRFKACGGNLGSFMTAENVDDYSFYLIAGINVG